MEQGKPTHAVDERLKMPTVLVTVFQLEQWVSIRTDTTPSLICDLVRGIKEGIIIFKCMMVI